MTKTRVLIREIKRTDQKIKHYQSKCITAEHELIHYLRSNQELVYGGMIVSFCAGFLLSNVKLDKLLKFGKQAQILGAKFLL